MKSKLRNVTVRLEENVAHWARLEAARKETSVSRLLGDILKERMNERGEYTSAMNRALGRKPFLKTDGHYLSREESHARNRLR
jgi:predicted DNA-binding ribbon-helix-helix protein